MALHSNTSILAFVCYVCSVQGPKVMFGLLAAIFIGLMDAFGIYMLLPLFSEMSSSSFTNDSDAFGLLTFVHEWAALPLPYLLALIVLIFVVKGVLVFGLSTWTGFLQADIMQVIRRALLREKFVLLTDPGRISAAGHALNVFNDQVNIVSQAVNGLNSFASGAVFFVIYFGASLNIAPLLSIYLGALCLFVGLLMQMLGFAVRSQAKKNVKFNSVMVGEYHSILKGLNYLRVGRNYESLRVRADRYIRDVSGGKFKLVILDAVVSASREPLGVFVLVLALALQVYVLDDVFADAIVISVLFYKGFSVLVGMQSAYHKIILGAVAIREFKDVGVISSVAENSQLLTTLTSKRPEKRDAALTELELVNLCFRANSERDILKNVSLKIQGPGLYLIYGASGAGKSTLLDIMLGLKQPNSGIVLWGGEGSGPLSEKKRAVWDKPLGFVPQSPILFNGSVRQNVSMNFDNDSSINSNELINRALHEARADTFISDLAGGIDTMIDASDVQFSGGEIQRLVLARELYKQPSILFLDEPSSALDSVSENALADALTKIAQLIPVIVVTHSEKLKSKATRSYWLDRGVLVGKS